MKLAFDKYGGIMVFDSAIPPAVPDAIPSDVVPSISPSIDLERIDAFRGYLEGGEVNIGIDSPQPKSFAEGGEVSTYTVKSGDIVSSIAQNHGTTTAAIQEANKGLDVDKIRVGQKLIIPSGVASRARVMDRRLASTFAENTLARAGYDITDPSRGIYYPYSDKSSGDYGRWPLAGMIETPRGIRRRNIGTRHRPLLMKEIYKNLSKDNPELFNPENLDRQIVSIKEELRLPEKPGMAYDYPGKYITPRGVHAHELGHMASGIARLLNEPAVADPIYQVPGVRRYIDNLSASPLMLSKYEKKVYDKNAHYRRHKNNKAEEMMMRAIDMFTNPQDRYIRARVMNRLKTFFGFPQGVTYDKDVDLPGLEEELTTEDRKFSRKVDELKGHVENIFNIAREHMIERETKHPIGIDYPQPQFLPPDGIASFAQGGLVLSEEELMKEELLRSAMELDRKKKKTEKHGAIRKPIGRVEEILQRSEPSPYDSSIDALKTSEQKGREFIEMAGLGPESILTRGPGLLGKGLGFFGLMGGRKFGLGKKARQKMLEAAEIHRGERGLLARPMTESELASPALRRVGLEELRNRFIPKDPQDFLKSQPGNLPAVGDELLARNFLSKNLSGTRYSERVSAAFQPKGVQFSRFGGPEIQKVADAFQKLPPKSQTLVRGSIKDASQSALKELGVPEQFWVFRTSSPNPNLALTPVTMDKQFALSARSFTRDKDINAHLVNRSDVIASVQHLKNSGEAFGDEFELLIPRKVLEKRPKKFRPDPSRNYGPRKIISGFKRYPEQEDIRLPGEHVDLHRGGSGYYEPNVPKDTGMFLDHEITKSRKQFPTDKVYEVHAHNSGFAGDSTNKSATLKFVPTKNPDIPGGKSWMFDINFREDVTFDKFGVRDPKNIFKSKFEFNTMINKAIKDISKRYPGSPQRLQVMFDPEDMASHVKNKRIFGKDYISKSITIESIHYRHPDILEIHKNVDMRTGLVSDYFKRHGRVEIGSEFTRESFLRGINDDTNVPKYREGGSTQYIGTIWFKDGKKLKSGSYPAARGVIESPGFHHEANQGKILSVDEVDSINNSFKKVAVSLSNSIYDGKTLKSNFINNIFDLIKGGSSVKKSIEDSNKLFKKQVREEKTGLFKGYSQGGIVSLAEGGYIHQPKVGLAGIM